MQTTKRTLNEDGVLTSEIWMYDGQKHRSDGPAVQTWNDYGTLTGERWYLDGNLHRTDGPALFSICIDAGDLHLGVFGSRGDGPAALGVFENWYLDGKFHRIDGPAAQHWRIDGTLSSEWYLNGKRHRTSIVKLSNGMLLEEQWYLDGKHHRIDGPALRYGEHGTLEGTRYAEHWFLKGKPHRTDGPAFQAWRDGTQTIAHWYVDGERHRTDGPAVQVWYPDGTLSNEQWYQDGKETSRRMVVLARARIKVLRASCLLILSKQ